MKVTKKPNAQNCVSMTLVILTTSTPYFPGPDMGAKGANGATDAKGENWKINRVGRKYQEVIADGIMKKQGIKEKWGLSTLRPADSKFAGEGFDLDAPITTKDGGLTVGGLVQLNYDSEKDVKSKDSTTTYGLLTPENKTVAAPRLHWKERMLDGSYSQTDVNIFAAEQLLRGYHYFRAENAQLTFNEYARRPLPVPPPVLTDEGLEEDDYIEKYGFRPYVDCARCNFSTFGMDVDTASYTQTRLKLRDNQLPDPETVRVEEFVNYFKQPYTVCRR